MPKEKDFGEGFFLETDMKMEKGCGELSVVGI